MSNPVIPMPSIIVFGETGAGKSSLINMFEGEPKAESGDGALGVTFCSTCYQRTIRGYPFKVFDTAGLNEAAGGTINPSDALNNLRKLVDQLDKGVHLLLYVMRQPRIKSTTQKNYRFFYAGICQKKVPIVIVITGLEERAYMDGWWAENEEEFTKKKMTFNGFACITATRGKRHIYDDQYEQSKAKVEDIIWKSYRRDAWKMPQSWITTIAQAYKAVVLGEEFQDVFTSSRQSASVAGSTSTPNVIVFGETGAGKSSIINMLNGDSAAQSSDGANSTTFGNNCYLKTIWDVGFKVYDTVGLNEGASGTVAARETIERLYNLVLKLDDGINLLVYVMRAPRIPPLFAGNYKLFHEIFCSKQVPIVIVVTGLEGRENMDQWWDENKKPFMELKMMFSGVACITSTMGKISGGSYIYEDIYEESKKKVEDLIFGSYLQNAWKMPPNPWLGSTIIRLLNFLAGAFGLTPILVAQELISALKQYAGYSDQEAKIEAHKIETKLRAAGRS